MNLTMYECVNGICTYVTREVNLIKEFLPLIIGIIIFAIILIMIHLRYKQLKKREQK